MTIPHIILSSIFIHFLNWARTAILLQCCNLENAVHERKRSSGGFLLGESKWEREEGDRGDQHLGTEQKRREKRKRQTERQTDRHKQRKRERWKAGRVNI